jgi:hypothetical protein
MRQQTRELHLESPASLRRLEAAKKNEHRGGKTPLGGIHVRVLGVDGAGKSSSYWQSLKKF